MTIKTALLLLSLTLAACNTTLPPDTQPITKPRAEASFIYTNPKGDATDLKNLMFKTNGMVRTDYPEPLGVGGTTYAHTRYGAWNSRTGQTDVFVIGNDPSSSVNLQGDQIYYGRALRAINQSVYENRLTYVLNFKSGTFTAFSVSPTSLNAFGTDVTMNGTLKNNSIVGTANSGRAKGTFSAQFYGQNGIEFVGIARFDNHDLDFSFGGDVQ